MTPAPGVSRQGSVSLPGMGRRRLRLHLACAIGACAALAGPSQAATATLVRDLVDAPQPRGSSPRDFVVNGARTLFVATTPEYGDEPWVTDGTAAGTRLLADIEPGRGDGTPAGIRCAVPFGEGFLLLWPSGPATTSSSRALALWRSDGTPGGTAAVMPLDAVGGCHMLALGGRVLFTVTRAVAYNSWALELWASDGTANGTQRLASFADRNERVLWLERAGDLVYFAPPTGDGTDLWRSDGSAAGTNRVAAVDANPRYPGARFLGGVGGVVLFEVTDRADANTRRLWRSDGTEAGTYAIAQSPLGGLGSPTAWRDRLFAIDDRGVTDRVLVTDGTVDGTAQHTTALDLRALIPVGERLFLLGAAASAVRVSRWDDPDAEPAHVTDIPGAWAGHRAVLPGMLLFDITAPDGAAELWRSDGTADGTIRLARGRIGSAFPFPRVPPQPFTTLTAAGPRAYFAADDRHGEFELWSSDGSTVGTGLLANLAADDLVTDDGTDGPRRLAAVGGRLVFTAYDGARAYHLWSSDGSAAGTAPLEGLAEPGASVLGFTGPAALADALYFGVSPLTGSKGVARTDGTSAGTRFVLPTAPDSVAQVLAAGDFLYAVVRDGRNGNSSICRLDGHGSDAVCTPVVHGFRALYPFGGRVLYVGSSAADETRQLWISDGTAAGTRMLRDLHTVDGGQGEQFATLGGEVFLLLFPRDAGPMLWRSDGTETGTVLVRRLDSSASGLTATGDRVFFTAGNVGEVAIWTSDGTEAGTQPVPGVRLSLTSSGPLARLGDAVLFSGYDDTHGDALWISDGSATGSRLVRDLGLGVASAGLVGFRELGDRVLFDGCAALGCEPWITDGTEAGTYQLADIAPGIAGSNPHGFVVLGDALYLVADDGLHGEELWRIALDAGCAGDCDRDGAVSIAEAVTAVGIALGERSVGLCRAADGDGDGNVTVDELIAAARAVLSGCF